MFRHRYASELLQRGAKIRDLLDHESVATTEIYSQVVQADQNYVRTKTRAGEGL